jgi:hypothetical protein
MNATISKLFPHSPPGPGFSSNGQQWLLLPKGASPPPENIGGTLANLVQNAHNTAEAMLAGSILAGPSSETDEFADVGAWIPEESLAGSTLEPEGALKALGLDSWGNEVSSWYVRCNTD